MAAVRNVLKNSSLFRQEAFVAGAWRNADSGKTYEIKNPANGDILGTAPDMTDVETKQAISVASDAFKSWRNTTGRERAAVLMNWFTLMKENSEELAQIMTLEAGKPLAEARGEIAYAASFLEWFAEESKRIEGEVPTSPSANKFLMFIRQPIGVVGLITPWNFPSAMLTRKAGAAIAAGCSCVAKPAEDTPFSSLALAALAEKAGLPKGVFNVLTCSRENASIVGKTLCTHDQVAGISFTGSTRVGKMLYRQCSDGVKRISLELGGNAPFIIFNSARLQTAVNGLMASKFRNSGQTCVSANRILVQSGIYEDFVQALKKVMDSQLKVGNGMEKDVTIGPLINAAQLEKVSGIVERSVAQGAHIEIGGSRHELGAHFFQPTLLTNCSQTMPCFQEEIFGPVIAVMKFETEEEAVDIANNTKMGLMSYFFSQDVAQVLRISQQLESGMVGVNEGMLSCAEGAFGGIKESGLGKEGSKHAFDDFTYLKYICIGDFQNK